MLSKQNQCIKSLVICSPNCLRNFSIRYLFEIASETIPRIDDQQEKEDSLYYYLLAYYCSYYTRIPTYLIILRAMSRKLSILALSMEVPHCVQLHKVVAMSAACPLGNITPAVALSMSDPVLFSEEEEAVALQL